MPQVKLESSRHAVSTATMCRSKSSLRPGPPAVACDEHGIGGEEAGEHDEVGEQEDPEAVADDDALRRGPLVPAIRAVADVPKLIGIARSGGASLTGVMPGSRARHAGRDPRLAPARVDPRDFLGRQLVLVHGRARRRRRRWQRRRRGRPPTSHQICQISAKPVTTAKKAVTKPVGLLRGISIGS